MRPKSKLSIYVPEGFASKRQSKLKLSLDGRLPMDENIRSMTPSLFINKIRTKKNVSESKNRSVSAMKKSMSKQPKKR
jgi:hypothetical protein